MGGIRSHKRRLFKNMTNYKTKKRVTIQKDKDGNPKRVKQHSPLSKVIKAIKNRVEKNAIRKANKGSTKKDT